MPQVLPKVTIVGAGQVGATVAHLLALKRLADLTLVDIVEGLAKGKALDLSQAVPIEGVQLTVTGTTDYAAMGGSRLVVVTAGLARKPGMSREDLLAANANIAGPIADKIAKYAKDAVVIVVTNPLDLMTYLTWQRTGFPPRRVMGMAGALDSSRLRAFLAERLGVPVEVVQAMVLGSHGDLMVPLPRYTTVNGLPVTDFLKPLELDEVFKRTRDAGAEIVALLKQSSAFYAPASGVVEMAEAILRDTHRVMPACAYLDGEYGLKDLFLGVPVELGAGGIVRVVELTLTSQESEALMKSAQAVSDGIKSLFSVVKAS